MNVREFLKLLDELLSDHIYSHTHMATNFWKIGGDTKVFFC